MIDVNAPALQERVKRILMDPKGEWPVIAAEATTTEKLYSSLIVPLAAIPVVANFIGSTIIGVTLPFISYGRSNLVLSLFMTGMLVNIGSAKERVHGVAATDPLAAPAW